VQKIHHGDTERNLTAEIAKSAEFLRFTTEFLRFTPETRRTRSFNIEYSVDGLLLAGAAEAQAAGLVLQFVEVHAVRVSIRRKSIGYSTGEPPVT
jgi:hypothetical protein